MPDYSKFDPFKLYEKHIAKDPRIEIPTLAAGGALAGRALSGPGVKLAMNLLFADLPPTVRQGLIKRLDSSKLKTLGTLAGAMAGTLYGVAKRGDTTGGWRGLLDSIKDPNYYKNNPINDFFRDEGRKEKIQNTWYDSKKKMSSFGDRGMDMLGKMASLGSNPFDKEVIPIRSSLSTIKADAFLGPEQKAFTSDIIYGADNKGSGVTSKHNLARSALKMGVGFASAYAFGQGVGGVLSLPPRITDRVSKIGGIAAAVHNSGIFK